MVLQTSSNCFRSTAGYGLLVGRPLQTAWPWLSLSQAHHEAVAPRTLMDVENGGDGKVSCKVAPYCQVLILGISRNQPINRWCMKTIQSIHHEKNLRDLEIRLFFQVYVQSLRDWKSWGLRWGILRILFIWVGRLLRGCRLRTV